MMGPAMWRALAIVAAAVTLLWASFAEAVDLRGRVDTQNPFNRAYYPLPNAEVLLVFNGQPVMRTITGFDGFYYFRNVVAGPHQIVVNRQLRVNVTIFDRPYQDLPPILFVPR